MHIIGIIIAVASAIFWLSRAARGVNEVADAANNLANMPRRFGFRKRASKRGIDLIDTPQDAATILMVSLANLSDYAAGHDGIPSEAATNRIVNCLKKYMNLRENDARELLTQMRWSVKDLVQPDTALAPMTNVLTGTISRDEADDVSDMLRHISHADGEPNPEQRAFIARVRERLGLVI